MSSSKFVEPLSQKRAFYISFSPTRNDAGSCVTIFDERTYNKQRNLNVDIFSKEQRSKIMSSVHGKKTLPEDTVAKHLFSLGYRYRRNVKNLLGHPDIVLRKYKIAIFVNGCYWHGHEGCKYAVIPKTNTAFWRAKIESNIKRDFAQEEKLKSSGWHVFVVWACDLKTKDKRLLVFEHLEKDIRAIVEVSQH